MPLGNKPTCELCKATNSTMWRKGSNGEVICNSCSLKQSCPGGEKDSNDSNGSIPERPKNNGNLAGPVLRKSARIKPTKHKYISAAKALATKGKSRRIVFKKSQPIKAPTAVSTIVTGESVFYDGMYYQSGDIVSLVDHDGSLYYAQIRGFMQDQYNEKSVVLSWLLPTQNSPKVGFDPSTYILGPEEDLPRKMEYIEFVCHAPSDYYKCRTGPYLTISREPELCYIWTTIGEKITPVPSTSEMFGMRDSTSSKSTGSKFSKEEKKEKGHKKQEKEKTIPVEVKKEIIVEDS
ncbi:GATA zinc finger domain-containing protein 1-like [Saccostrea echinata]|uniref:GATA zinc finger domain-containing protein 1-like n=1 Tax=Saccostrea echinata TaxID=191078 RepID=UPI002A7FB9DE|nr:GATA zinc finger domain-containing protein 1-like [Saccostrea echinata]